MQIHKTPFDPHFHVVLHEPEIPQNTGNIGRTCLAMGACLHLIEPLGFDLDEKALRRAGLDYWPRLSPRIYPNWGAYIEAHPDARRWYFTARKGRAYFEVAFSSGDHLVFGKETAGLPRSLLEGHEDAWLSIPMRRGERSLNLSTVVCAALCEGVRQGIDAGWVGLGDGAYLL
ncbi:MAG: tRNA (cytidine(34)-2'-O)-methyltransferase [Phycisphaeraceae bacterium]|nr:tRNA (cytidine(34)-2'-O)-methyltransferase [Phycisphaeraceae bacterium]